MKPRTPFAFMIASILAYFLLLATILCGGTAHAAVWREHAKLIASGGEALEAFGASVAISGNEILVGAPSFAQRVIGAAYLFHYDGSNWVQARKVTGDLLPFAGFGFGAAVSLDHGTAVVGGGHNAQIIAEDAAPINLRPTDTLPLGSAYGESVAISGNHALVGAPGADAAFFFENDGFGWRQTGKVNHPPPYLKYIGGSVAIDGRTVVVGAWRNDDTAPSYGAAYVYVIPEATTLTLLTTLAPLAALGLLRRARHRRKNR